MTLPTPNPRIAIQGDLGSNSHAAALHALGPAITLVPCTTAAQVFESLANNFADQALLPIENSLHGSVFEHYDLLHEAPVHITAETQIHISHAVIAAPGVTLAALTSISSHPVALSQCRRWLHDHPALTVIPGYDTAGAVRQLMASGFRTAAAIAPPLAAEIYQAQILQHSIEDHPQNYTRFYLLTPGPPPAPPSQANKFSVAFTLDHTPGALLRALQSLAAVNLTKMESRPVHGRPWEYVFFADARFETLPQAQAALTALAQHSHHLRTLGIYPAATQ